MILKEIIIKRRILIFTVFIILFLASLLKVILFPVYEASALIMVDIKKAPTSIQMDRMDANEMLSLVRVHIRLMQSTPVLKTVVEDLKLYNEFSDNRGLNNPSSELDKEKKTRRFIELLQKKYLFISSPPFTNLIEIKGEYKNQQLVAEIVNTTVKNYLHWNLGFQHSQVDKLIEYLENEIKNSKEQLQMDEDNLRKFKEENNIIALPEKIKSYFQILPEEFKSHYQMLRDFEIKLLGLEVELSRLKELYTEESPQVVYLKKTIERVKEEIDKQSKEFNFNEDFLSKLKEVPKEEMMLARLMRDVKLQESLYTFLVEELEKARLLAAKQVTEDIKVVYLAEVPLKPTGRIKGAAIGFVISLIFSLILAIILENRPRSSSK